MEIRAFAEAVLRSDRLEDKLIHPGVLTDLQPGPPLSELPERPGRPAELALGRPGRAPFPSRSALQRASGRGLALHFFANHELLAMELMALMLLRFVDAPPAFRADLARTITEEQDHLRRYRDRMQALSVSFGDAPVNAFFWRAMRDVATPLDFVVQMALTFEQANLDYCVWYRDRFRDAGDEASAELLQDVYEDEIGHVLHGREWFDRWRPAGTSAWEAYLAHLTPPLTAARAKGPVLDVDGRRRAGLPDDFIRHLRVFTASKGRRPDLYLFEPAMEDALANPEAPSSKAVAALIQDLGPLMGLLAHPDDLVALDHPVRLEHLEALDAAGIEYPRVVTPAAVDADQGGEWEAGRLVPWGWSPRLARGAQQRFGQAAPIEAVRALCAKPTARAALQTLLQEQTDDTLLGPPEQLVGRLARDSDEALAAVDDLAALGFSSVVKAPFSASGRHRVRLARAADAGPRERAFLDGAASAEAPMWVAPWLPRLRDLSVVLSVDEDGRARTPTLTWLLNNPSGVYVGHVLAPMDRGLAPEDRRAVNTPFTMKARALRIADHVAAIAAEHSYVGPLGIDMFLYRDPSGATRLHPLVEINPRHTMGHVALRLRRTLAPRAVGVFRLVHRRELQRAAQDRDPFVALAQRWRTEFPVVRGDSGLRSGCVCLTDPAETRRVLAVLSVGDDVQAALRPFRGWSEPTPDCPR